MFFESLKEKCYYYQKLNDYKLMPNGYILVHLDGKNFSKLIKNKMEKPFDDDFINAMNETAKYLCENVPEVKCAFVQSDEISLFIKNGYEADLMFGGRLCKLQSILASMATAKFNREMEKYYMEKDYLLSKDLPDEICLTGKQVLEEVPLYNFDCKIWNVPDINDVKAWFLFRRNDCVRNSRQQTAQTYCSHKELVGKDTMEQIKYLKEKTGIDWEGFDKDKKCGRFFYKQKFDLSKELNGEKIDYNRLKWVKENGMFIENYFMLRDDFNF